MANEDAEEDITAGHRSRAATAATTTTYETASLRSLKGVKRNQATPCDVSVETTG